MRKLEILLSLLIVLTAFASCGGDKASQDEAPASDSVEIIVKEDPFANVPMDEVEEEPDWLADDDIMMIPDLPDEVDIDNLSSDGEYELERYMMGKE